MTQSAPPDTTPDGEAAAPGHPVAAVASLKEAMRRARLDDAERAGARAELRAARLGRLEILQDSLQPLLAQIPNEVDLFDIALVPSSEPRLFIDMIGFVEMGRDARSYILQQDTRHGRIRVAETESLDTMVDAVTDYVARRLLERDKALASDAKSRPGAKWTEPKRAEPKKIESESVETPPPQAKRETAAEPRLGKAPTGVRRRAGPVRWAGVAFAFLIDLLGAITFFTIIGAIGWLLWNRMHAPM